MSRHTEYHNRIREQAIYNLGARCWYCWKTENLEIDHISEDGYKERRKGHSRTHVLRASKGDTTGLQLLCVGCHRRKTAIYNWVKSNRELKAMEVRYNFVVSGD